MDIMWMYTKVSQLRIRYLRAALAVGIFLLASNAAQASAVRIEQYGDSTTEGWQVAGAKGYVTPMSSPAQLQAKLQGAFGSAITVSNQGVGGTTAYQLLNGVDGVHQEWPQQMATSTAQIVTLNFGLNEAYYSQIATQGVPQQSPAQFKSILAQLVTVAKGAGKIVILMEPHPVCEPIRQDGLALYVQAIRDVAAEQAVDIVRHFDRIAGLPDWQELLSDCLHPADALYGLKASAEFDVIAPIVRRLVE